jgi:hypothetical protein
MPRLDKCVPSFLNKFISRARMLQWRITQPPKLNTRFLTRRLTRLCALSIALPSISLCQYLLCKISDHIIITSGSNARRRSKSHYISVNNWQLFVKPRSLEPSWIMIKLGGGDSLKVRSINLLNSSHLIPLFSNHEI